MKYVLAFAVAFFVGFFGKGMINDGYSLPSMVLIFVGGMISMGVLVWAALSGNG